MHELLVEGLKANLLSISQSCHTHHPEKNDGLSQCPSFFSISFSSTRWEPRCPMISVGSGPWCVRVSELLVRFIFKGLLT